MLAVLMSGSEEAHSMIANENFEEKKVIAIQRKSFIWTLLGYVIMV